MKMQKSGIAPGEKVSELFVIRYERLFDTSRRVNFETTRRRVDLKLDKGRCGGEGAKALSQESFFRFRAIRALENPPEHPLLLRNYVLFAVRRVKTVPEYFIIPRQPRGRLLPLWSPFAFTLGLARLIRSARETVKLHYYTCLFAGQILIYLIPKGGPKLHAGDVFQGGARQ